MGFEMPNVFENSKLKEVQLRMSKILEEKQEEISNNFDKQNKN